MRDQENNERTLAGDDTAETIDGVIIKPRYIWRTQTNRDSRTKLTNSISNLKSVGAFKNKTNKNGICKFVFIF